MSGAPSSPSLAVRSEAVAINRAKYSRDQQDTAFAFSVPVLRKAPLPPPAPVRKPRAASIDPPALDLPGTSFSSTPTLLLTPAAHKPILTPSANTTTVGSDSDSDDEYLSSSVPTRRVQISRSAPVDSFLTSTFMPSFTAIEESDNTTTTTGGTTIGGSSSSIDQDKLDAFNLGKSPTVFSLMKTHVLNGADIGGQDQDSPRSSKGRRAESFDDTKFDDDDDRLGGTTDDISGGVFSMSLESGGDMFGGDDTTSFAAGDDDFYSG